MAEQKYTFSVVDKTRSTLKNISAGLGGVASSVFSLQTAFVGLAGAAGVGLLVKSSLNATDALAKTATKIGTTTEALAQLRFAAELSGVATTTVDMAMQRFTRRLSEAARGTGEAKSALQELNIDARELQRLPLDEQMLVLSDSFQSVRNESDKVRLAFKLFDSEGVSLVNTLGLGREQLQGFFEEAQDLGLALSTAAATGVEEANDALTKLGSLFKGLTDQTVAALAPAIAVLTDTFRGAILSFAEAQGGVEKFSKSLATGVLNAVRVSLAALQELVNGVIKSINTASAAIQDFGGFFTADDEKNARQLTEQINRLNESINDPRTRQTVKANEKEERDRLIRLREIAKAAGNIGRIETVTFADDANAVIDNLIDSLNKVQESGQAVTNTLGVETQSALEIFLETMKNLRPPVESLDVSLANLANRAIDGLGKSFTDAITGAKSFADAIKSMAKQVIDSLIQMLIQKYLVDAAFGAITGAFSGGNTGGFNTVRSGSGPTQIPLGIPNYTQRANGGPVMAGSSYVVGEKGPEVFVPRSSGTIVPNGSSGVTINQSINISTGVQNTVRAEIVNLMPQIQNATKSAVLEARTRGGSFSTGLVGA